MTNRSFFSKLLVMLAAAALAAPPAEAQALRTNAGFNSISVPRNDDESSELVSMGFTINLFGKLRSSGYVNNNGNMTFDGPLATYTPFGLRGTEREIIAPFFADVDTRPEGSKVVTYGQDVINGHRAFGVNYIDVGYYANHVDKTNSFQMVLIEREDLSPGDFDIEFNYERIEWETGDASDGEGGLGGTSASVGWSNGVDTSFELPGSLQPGAFLDGGPYSLVRQSITGAVANSQGAQNNSNARAGRLVFRARDGVISPGLVISGGALPDAVSGVYYEQRLTVGGADPPYQWQLLPDVVAPPGLTLYSNGDLAGTPTTPGTYGFTVAVTGQTEDGELTAYERASVTVRAPAVHVVSTCPLPDASVGYPYSWNLTATGAGNIKWRLLGPSALPQGLSLSPSGLLAGTPQKPGTYALNFDVTADGATPGHLECKLTVIPSGVSLANCRVPNATVGVPFSHRLQAAGGVSPYTYQLIGDLPQGVVMRDDGTVEGTATFYGLWLFKVVTIDSANQRNVHDCGFIVDPAKFSTSVCPLPSGTTGVPYSATLEGGHTWSLLGQLPAGLTLNPSGSISGTPMTAGAAQFQLLATDGQGAQTTEACSLIVERGPLGVLGCPLPDTRVGDDFLSQITGVGGIFPYTVTTVAGGLPPGLQLTTGGAVTGKAAKSGSYGFTVLVRDSSSEVVTQACRVTVAPAQLSITSACPVPNGHAGEAYSFKVAAAGGATPYQFSFGPLPDGLTGAADGTISGTPLHTGARSFAISVTDALGAAAHQACAIDIRQPQVPALSLADPPATVTPASSLTLQVKMERAYSAPVRGEVVLHITPETAGTDPVVDTPDPHLAFANGQRVASFTIPAGQTSANIALVSTGTVASTVQVSLRNLTASGAPVTQHPGSVFFRIAPAVPTITSACYVRQEQEAGLALTLRLTGFSNTRELRQARVTVPGLTKPTTKLVVPEEFVIEQTDTLVIDAQNEALRYFSTPLNVVNGGAFTLTLPALFQQEPQYLAPTAILQGVTVELVNRVGTSPARAVTECP